MKFTRTHGGVVAAILAAFGVGGLWGTSRPAPRNAPAPAAVAAPTAPIAPVVTTLVDPVVVAPAVPSATPGSVFTGSTGSTGGTVTTGDGQDDFSACKSDIATHCAGIMGSNGQFTSTWSTFATDHGYSTGSPKLALTSCLSKNPLTAACQSSQGRRSAINVSVNTLCAPERGAWCSDVEPLPGKEPQIDCLLGALKANTVSFSWDCCSSLSAHEAAKPAGMGKFPAGVVCMK